MSKVADHFGDIAATYDSMALRAMPRYEEMLSEIVRCLPEGLNELLELGCGTGTAVDAAPQMVEIARNRVLDSLDAQRRISFAVSLFEEMDLFYRRLHHALRPGGFLVFGGELNTAVPNVHTLNRDEWLDFARQPGHTTEGEIEETLLP